MYSKKTSGIGSGDYIITPPPGYDGSRFGSRSDGRDDAFPPYDRTPQIYSPKRSAPSQQMKECEHSYECEKETDAACSSDKECEQGGLFPFLKRGIGQEELLLIALLIVLVCEREVSPEIILMLGLLLCI